MCYLVGGASVHGLFTGDDRSVCPPSARITSDPPARSLGSPLVVSLALGYFCFFLNNEIYGIVIV